MKRKQAYPAARWRPFDISKAKITQGSVPLRFAPGDYVLVSYCSSWGNLTDAPAVVRYVFASRSDPYTLYFGNSHTLFIADDERLKPAPASAAAACDAIADELRRGGWTSEGSA